jgi:putative transposase
VLWLSRRTDELPNVFSDNGRIKEQQDNEKLQSELYQQIGKLKVELEQPEIPIYRQCELLGLSRSSLYYRPVGISEYNLLLMDMIDRKYTQHPFYGILRMTAWLRGEGHEVNHKRIQRLMQLMGGYLSQAQIEQRRGCL